MRKWLMVSMHDERYDFNFNLSVVEATREQLTPKFIYQHCPIDVRGCEVEDRRGILIYKQSKRRAIQSPRLETVAETLETVHFGTVYLIPLDAIESGEVDGFWDDVVTRNLKYGFLDLKR